jgi:hypothetical protein
MLEEFCKMARGTRARDGGDAVHIASDGRLCTFESGAMAYEQDHRKSRPKGLL